MSAGPLTELTDNFLLSRLRIRYENEKSGRNLTDDTTLEYAWCLVRSKEPATMKEGISLLEEMLQRHQACIEFRKRCLYNVAVGYARTKDFHSAFRAIGSLRQLDPHDQKTVELNKAIESAVNRDAAKGALGTVVTMGAIAAVAMALLK